MAFMGILLTMPLMILLTPILLPIMLIGGDSLFNAVDAFFRFDPVNALFGWLETLIPGGLFGIPWI